MTEIVFPTTQPLRAPQHRGATTTSCYIPMRDGVRLAVDISLPRDLAPGVKISALLAMTRYWRSQQLKTPWAWFLAPPDAARAFFTAYGYAVLRVDMRGTGASFGGQPHPWPASDLTDMFDLVAWVVDQPWSNGRVGAFGNSYQATTAEMLGACGHPAVTSALARFNEYDVYSDIAFPGGVPNAFILREWAAFNRALDANRPPKQLPLLERLIVKGVKPVDAALPQAIAEHAQNRQVDSALAHVTFRDDYDPVLGATIDDLSIHTRSTRHILDHWGSWFDAATADAVIRRFAHNPRPQRAVIGPWNHGAAQHVGSAKNPFPPRAQMAEALRFFDAPPTTRALHYFTINEGRWKTTLTWPPAGATTVHFYFQPDNGLAVTPPATAGADRFTVDFTASTGRNNRWQTELDQRLVRYTPQKKLLAYISAPLAEDIEITGYPVVTLFISSTHDDGAFFVYLETVDEADRSQYLTEGMLRAIHRKISTPPPPYRQFIPYHSFRRADALPLIPDEAAELTFGLQPISALVRRGARLRVAIAGADADTFSRVPATGAPRVTILLGGATASGIEIPVIRP